MNQGRGEQTKQDILQAAQGLFLTKGYGSTSMRDIAKAAGDLSVGSLYNHFTGKEMLFATLISESSPHPYLLDLIATVQGESAPDFIRTFLRRMVPLMLERFQFLELVQIDLREFGGRNMRALLEHYIPVFVLLIGNIQALAGLKPLPPAVLLRFMAGTMVGYLFTEQFAPAAVRGLLSDDEWLDQLADFILHGISTASLPSSEA
jgi:AcrR family transcriptional regulator